MRSSINKRLQQLELARQIQQVPKPRGVCVQLEPEGAIWDCGNIGITDRPPSDAILFRFAAEQAADFQGAVNQ